MTLGDLHKKLYSKDEDIEKTKLADDFFDPKKKLNNDQGTNSPDLEKETPQGPTKVTEDVWLSPEDLAVKGQDLPLKQEQHKVKYLKFGAIALGVLICLTLVVLGVVKYRESIFSEDKVILEIVGPTEIKSGDEVSFDVNVTNRNRVSLDKSELNLSFSEDFLLTDQPGIIKEGYNGAKTELGSLKSGERKTVTVKAKVFGPISKQVYFNSSLIFQPSNFSSTFEKKAQLPGLIKSSLLSVNAFATREAASGEEVEVQLIVQNNSSGSFNDLQVKADYPDGFTYRGSQPEAIDKNNWDIAEIKPGAQEKIIIRGTLEGQADVVRNFKVSIGQKRSDQGFLKLSEAETLTKLVASRLVIKQIVNNKDNFTANSGEQMIFQVKLKNNSQAPLRDLIVSDKLSSPVLDKASVSVENGFYDSSADKIIWKASDVPALKVLEPNAETEVVFRAKLLDKFPMQSEKDENFVLTSQASVETLDIDSPLPENKTVFSNNLDIKVNSKLVLNVTANYNDGELANSGPVPLQYAQETTLTIRFNLLNTSNDLRDVVLTASLPSGVKWKDKYLPEDVKGIEFNERTNELVWRMGTVSAGTGFILPIKSLAFQLGITPSMNQNLSVIPLLNPVKVTAVDNFTNQPVKYEFREISTSDVSDL